jgi:hypothetical protein
VIVAVGVGEGTIVGVAVPLVCVGVDVMGMLLAEAVAVAFELCVECALMLVSWHAINEKMQRSRHPKTGCIILPVWFGCLILFIPCSSILAPDYPHASKHRKGLRVEIIVKKAQICRLAFSECLC